MVTGFQRDQLLEPVRQICLASRQRSNGAVIGPDTPRFAEYGRAGPVADRASPRLYILANGRDPQLAKAVRVTTGDPPWREAKGGILLNVRLTPKAQRDAVVGLDVFDGMAVLKARVRALPTDGNANDALVKLIAAWIGLPKSCVTVTSGQKSRVKTLSIEGAPVELHQRLADKLAALLYKSSIPIKTGSSS